MSAANHRVVNSHSVAAKKPSGVSLRETSKLQLIQRQNSQKGNLGLNQRDQGVLSHRGSNRGNLQTNQASDLTSAGASRNNIVSTMRRQQQASQDSSAVNQTEQAEASTLQSASCMRDFHVHKKIGAGAYSEVYQVTRKSDGIEYALKQVKIQRLTEKEKENALNEVRILASINNVNVIAYKEAFFDEASSTLCIVMEFAGMGDLYEKIMNHQKNATEFQEREIWEALVQMTAGLKALHDRNIFHRDLKSANIFQSQDGTYKMGDLNVSKIAQDGMLYTQTGTPYYASPEVWQEKPYDKKSDIWSLGCIIYEMCSLNPPFRAKSMKGLYNSVLSGSYPKLPQHYSHELSQIIKSLLTVNPAKRPSCEQILQHSSILDFLNSRRNSAFSENLRDEDKSQIQDVLLKTIHCPRNLSQLSQILPRSKYQSGIGASLSQSINNQQQLAGKASVITGVLPVFDLPVQTQVPQTAATDERKGKRRVKPSNINGNYPDATGQASTPYSNLPPNALQSIAQCPSSSQHGDRNHIIEMAQQIVLPPIRESADGPISQPTMLQLQQQRQKELLSIRRKQNGTNKSKATLDASNEVRARPQQPQKADQVPPELQSQQPQVETDVLQQQKKKMKSQLQIRQQIGRVAQKELMSLKKQSESTAMLPNNSLSNYPMDLVTTLAAQNLQCMENFAIHTGSQIEMPPSISNIYATANTIMTSHGQTEQILQNRLNGQPAYEVMTMDTQQPVSSRKLDENRIDQTNSMMNQPITAIDLSHKQKQHQQQLQGNSLLKRNSSSVHRMQVINENRQSMVILAQQQQQHSQSNLLQNHVQRAIATEGSNGNAALRYQTTNTINEMVQQPVVNSTLPGLKLNLQSMKNSQQLQKLTPGDQQKVSNSMKVKQSAKQQQAMNEVSAQARLEKSSSNRNLKATAHELQKHHTQNSHQLPPRQHSTTRNGPGPSQRSQVQSKIKGQQMNANTSNCLQPGSNNLSQRSLHKKNSVVSSSQQLLQSQQYKNQDLQSAEISSTLATNAKGNNSPRQHQLPHQMTPAGGSKGSLPASAFTKQRQKVHTASQKQLKEIDVAESVSRQQTCDHDSQRQLLQHSSKQIRKQGCESVVSAKRSKVPQHEALVQQTTMSHPQTRGTNRDKSQIMVELMPLQGNSGRAQNKMHTGRNIEQFDNFNQKMEQRTTEQESLRIIQRENPDLGQMKQQMSTIAPVSLPRMSRGINNTGQMISKRSSTLAVQQQKQQFTEEEEVYTDPESPEKQREDEKFKEKKSQIKQLQKKQQSILTKKARKATLNNNDSPSHLQQFTKAQFLEMPHSLINKSSSVVAASSPASKLDKYEALHSFDGPKKSHRILPAPQHETNKSKQRGQASGLNKSNMGSNQLLPNLKNTFEENTEGVANGSQTINHRGGIQRGSSLQRIETKLNERSKQVAKEQAVSSNNAGQQPACSGAGQYEANSLEQSKQQYLEQLRQLASIRHQKKQAGMKTQLSVQTKKNGGNKAAELLALSAQSANSSPMSNKIVSSYNQQVRGDQQPTGTTIKPFNARSSVPKLPNCHDTRSSNLNNNNDNNNQYDQSN